MTAASPLLRPFLEEPERAAILTDVDGTLAPIVERPERAAVPAEASRVLKRLAGRFALVACISGRQAVEARRLVGLKELAYAGNHGMELLRARDGTPELSPGAYEQWQRGKELVAELGAELGGLRLEDKGPIQALHWRGSDDEVTAESRAREIAAKAEVRGLNVHWGRKVLELRPSIAIGKDTAVAELLTWASARHAIYAGDDRTDLDAFRRLRELRRDGDLETAVCVGILSAEGPAELAPESDLTLDGPTGWLELLGSLSA